nr:MAG TPA: RNA polymerase subunit [Bacteriophage sp.]
MKKGQSRSDRNRPVACFGARVRVGDAAASFERISTLGPKRVKFLQDLTLFYFCCRFFLIIMLSLWYSEDGWWTA